MGYEGVKAAIKSMHNETVPIRIDTGVYLVTRDNLSQPKIQQLISH